MKILFAADTSFKYVDPHTSDAAVKQQMSEPADEFAKADFSVVNLENIFGDKDKCTPIPKSGPNLISDESFIRYIDALNPTVVGLANNHSKDYGEEALFGTMDILHAHGYTTIGAGKNIEEAYKSAVLEKDGIKAAIIAVCENEFGGAKDNVSGTAVYALGRVTKAILEARKNGCLPIIYFHGGNEGNPFPSPMKVELYRHFIDLGACAVIAMHTHCPQGNEYYKGCPIVYSMGNFFFTYPEMAQTKAWYYGYMSVLDITAKGIELSTIPYCFDDNGVKLLKGKELEHFEKYMEFIKEPISDMQKIRDLFDGWCIAVDYVVKRVSGDFGSIFEKTQSELAAFRNLFNCEAHNEVITNTFAMLYEGGRLENAKKTAEKYTAWRNLEIE